MLNRPVPASQGEFNMDYVTVQVIVVGDPADVFAGARLYQTNSLSGVLLDLSQARQHMFVLEGHHVLTFMTKVICPMGACAERLRESMAQQWPGASPSDLDTMLRQQWPGAANVLQVFSRIKSRPFVRINRFLSDQLTPVEVMRVAIMRNISGQQSFQGFTKTEAYATAWKVLGESSSNPGTVVPFNVNVPGSGTPAGPSAQLVVTPLDRTVVSPHTREHALLVGGA